jgi:hypothetical protein
VLQKLYLFCIEIILKKKKKKKKRKEKEQLKKTEIDKSKKNKIKEEEEEVKYKKFSFFLPCFLLTCSAHFSTETYATVSSLILLCFLYVLYCL